MRQDEFGEPCPATLGEYRDLCAPLGGERCKAVAFLDGKIAASPHGRDEEVITPDLQMRALLMPWLLVPADTAPAVKDPRYPSDAAGRKALIDEGEW